MDALGTKLGVGGLTAELEFSLLAVVGALGTCVRTLVPGRTGDTWMSCKQRGERLEILTCRHGWQGKHGRGRDQHSGQTAREGEGTLTHGGGLEAGGMGVLSGR